MTLESESDRFWSKIVCMDNGCLEYTGCRNHKGYGFIAVRGKKSFLTHRFAWILKNGEIPAGVQVLHRCDNPICCNVRHLFLGTNDDNYRDKVSKGRQARGERIRRSVGGAITADLVHQIRALPKGSFSAMARKLGVDDSTIGEIYHRKTWAHID